MRPQYIRSQTNFVFISVVCYATINCSQWKEKDWSVCLHQMFMTNVMVQDGPQGRKVISRMNWLVKVVCGKWDVYRRLFCCCSKWADRCHCHPIVTVQYVMWGCLFMWWGSLYSFIREWYVVEVHLCISLREDILRRNANLKLTICVMNLLCCECSPLKQ